MDLLIFGLGLVSLILLANLLVLRNIKSEQRLFLWLLFLLNVPVFLMGAAFAILPADLLDEIMAQLGTSATGVQTIGLTLVLTAVWSMVVTVTSVRQRLARWMPLDPESSVHTLALMLAGYLIGQSALTLSQGGLVGLAQSAQPASIGLFVLSELYFAVIAIFGVGYLIRRHGQQLLQRLGIERPQPRQLLFGLGWIAALVILQAIAGAVWALLNPEQAELLSNLNTLLLANVDTVWEWLALALAAGIGEEVLFRGALQPVLGLGFTAVLFALVHVQYGLTPITLFVVFLAVILGLVRRRYNTTTAIFVHVGYDFVLGLAALLASYLEQYVA